MPCHVYRKAGTVNWWIDVKVKGRDRIRRSAGTTDRKTAQAVAESVEAKEWQRHIKGDPASLTFAEAVMMYVADGHGSRFLAPLVAHFKDTKVAAIKAGTIRAACPSIYPAAGPATWNRQVVTPCRAVINHAAGKDMTAFIRVKRFPELKKVQPVPSSDWLPRFMAKADPRIAALALFTRITGARIGQAVAMDWSAVNLGEATAIVPPAKGFPERLAHLTPQMVASLANLTADKRGRVFGYQHAWSVYKPWRAACEAAGLPYITSHLTGRRGFFTAMARNGIDAKTAGELGGLASSRLVLEVYTEARRDRGLIDDVFGTFESQPETNKSKKSNGDK